MIELTEDELLACFRCYRGGRDFLGVKSPWWAKLNIGWEQELGKQEINRWRPTTEQITLSEILLFHVIPRLSVDERKILILRCGTGFKRSFRKCGKDVGLHHEVFRQQYQLVIEKLQKVLDEVG